MDYTFTAVIYLVISEPRRLAGPSLRLPGSWSFVQWVLVVESLEILRICIIAHESYSR